MSIIETIAKQRVPIDSYVSAGSYCSSLDLPKEVFETKITEIIGWEFSHVELHMPKFIYSYLCQEAVRQTLNNEPLFLTDLLALAERKAKHFINSHPWIFVTSETEEVVYKTDGSIKVKHKKGWKREQAYKIYVNNHDVLSKKEIIERFINELDMSNSGALTYFHNCKKRHSDR